MFSFCEGYGERLRDTSKVSIKRVPRLALLLRKLNSCIMAIFQNILAVSIGKIAQTGLKRTDLIAVELLWCSIYFILRAFFKVYTQTFRQ